MNRRSVPAFVLSLIAGIISILVGFYSAWFLVIIFAFVSEIQSMLFFVAGCVCIIGGIIAIVGGSMCLKRVNIGAILLTIASAITGVALVFMFVKILTLSSDDSSAKLMSIGMGMFTIVPVIMYVIATICAYRAKPKSGVKDVQQFAYTQNVQVTQATEHAVQNNENQSPSDNKIE